jgi:hypothetical protein
MNAHGEDSVSENECSICSAWPRRDRPLLRRKHFFSDIRIALDGTCRLCRTQFWTATGILDDAPLTKH